MTKKILLAVLSLIVLAGCSNTPEVVNIQATIDAAVSTAVAPYEEKLNDFITADMLQESQNNQNRSLMKYVEDEIGKLQSENEKTPETNVNTGDVFIYDGKSGAVSTATPSVYTYDNTNCVDRYEYQYDMTIPDGMVLTPNTVFDKSWYITNTGTCTWNSKYKITYMSGDIVSKSLSYPILQSGYILKPGESTVVTAQLIAPDMVGSSFSTYWAIESGNGEKFGSGEAKNVYLTSNFRVDNTFRVWENFSSLSCSDDSGYFMCGSRSTSNGRGAVYYDDSPMLESGRSHGSPAIVVIPPAGENTTVRFEFGPLRFPRRSSFYSNFCCRPDTPTCDVQARLYVREPGYGERLVAESREWNDGFMGEWKFVLDDINVFDQEFVYIIEVQANGGATNDDLIMFTNTRLY